ncbi:Heterokaryon incompatibility protein [Paramyrothecium foliicola]|nr:Heterokaryon incompatibility protein [Paramyrothecium foliicola]
MAIHKSQDGINQDEKSVHRHEQALDIRPSATVSLYRPLSQQHDGTRLLKIEPAHGVEGVITCRLFEAAFYDKPKFQALSYMWGEGPADCRIVINGSSYYVRKNLWDALHYLRIHKPETFYWIDAICINQDDVMERNRQVKLMHHIYFRAQRVIVWLGKSYEQHTELLQPYLEALNSHKEFDEPSNEKGAKEETEDELAVGRLLANKLSQDGYWNRLWIIQEIRHAHDIRVCFGASEMEWASFIAFLATYATSPEGPTRLHRLREGKYTSLSTLVYLLQEHKDALCQDRKDKVYGLVGLASDARGFPVDYEKSASDIWIDTMEFISRNTSFSGNTILSMGALVKTLLMDDTGSPFEGSSISNLPAEGEAITKPLQPKPFVLQAAVLGRVIQVGPQTKELIGVLDKVDEWRYQVQENFKDDLGNAHRESDMLLEAILHLDNTALSNKCYNCNTSIRWEQAEENSTHLSHLMPNKKVDLWDDWGFTSAQDESYEPEVTPNEQVENGEGSPDYDPQGGPHIFQMADGYEGKPTLFKMGLASAGIQAGDLICWFQWPRRAVVVRGTVGMRKSTKKLTGKKKKQSYWTYTVVGTAVVAEDVKQQCLGSLQRDDWSEDRAIMDVHLDARTLFNVLCD